MAATTGIVSPLWDFNDSLRGNLSFCNPLGMVDFFFGGEGVKSLEVSVPSTPHSSFPIVNSNPGHSSSVMGKQCQDFVVV